MKAADCAEGHTNGIFTTKLTKGTKRCQIPSKFSNSKVCDLGFVFFVSFVVQIRNSFVRGRIFAPFAFFAVNLHSGGAGAGTRGLA